MARVPNRRNLNKARMATRSIRNSGYGMSSPIIEINTDDISNTISYENEVIINDLKHKKIKLLSQKARLNSNLNKCHISNYDLSQLSKFFDNINTSELEKINIYHDSITKLLQKEIEEEIEKIDLLIEEIDEDIEDILSQSDINNNSINPYGYSKAIPNEKNDTITVTINPVVNGTDITIDENLLNSLRKEIKRLKASERKSYLSRLVYLAQVENIYKALKKSKKNNED